jgi:hypothetical protein
LLGILGHPDYQSEVVSRTAALVGGLHGRRAAAFFLTGAKLGRLEQEMEIVDALPDGAREVLLHGSEFPFIMMFLSSDVTADLDNLPITHSLRLKVDSHVRRLSEDSTDANLRVESGRFLGCELADAIIAELQATSANSPLRVFMCHSSQDKLAVMTLRKRLMDEGFAPWVDSVDLVPGQDWEREIRAAVRGSDVVLVCLSEDLVSKAGFRHREIRFALDVASEQPEGAIFIIPVKLESCEVPERLRMWHWVELYSQGGEEKLVRALRAREASVYGRPASLPGN